MVALSTAPVRFVPPWRAGEPDAPAYFLRPGSVLEREQLEGDLAGDHRAGRVFQVDLEHAFAEGLAALLADDPAGRDTLLALVAAEADGTTLDQPDRQMLREARELVAGAWPDYRALIAQLERRRQIAPLVAFRRFCVGWEGPEPTFRRSPDGMVHLEPLAGLSPIELRAAGGRAYELLYAGHQAGNSAAPSPSDDGPRTSTSDDASAKGGRSMARAGRKTPGSSSRSRSSR